MNDARKKLDTKIDHLEHEQEALQAKLNDVNQELIVTRRECDKNQSMVDNMENIIDNIFKIHDEAISGRI